MGTIRSSREEWLERVRCWVASGRPCREFADESGINAQTLSWWKWRLSRDGEDLRPGRDPIPRPSFVEITQVVAVDRSSAACERLELVVDETIVRLPVGFDGSCLERVLDVLEARR